MQFLERLIILLLAFASVLHLHAQQPMKLYEKEWKKVDELMNKQLPKSALQEVKKIYDLAKKAQGAAHEAQVIKALVYMSNLQDELRENNRILSISEIEKEINLSKEPAQSVLNSLLAGMYWNYYQSHRWELFNRSETVNFNKEDIATWSAEDFHRKISELYLLSIKNQKLLQQTRLEPLDAIIIKGNVRHLRPTLFDLLAHSALNYFENDERDIRKPAYAFQIDQPAAFQPAAEFIHSKFTTRDSVSLQHKALLIYQDLLAFHLKNPKPDALIDADIQRIAFVYNNSVHPEKEGLYIEALRSITNKYADLPAASQAWYLQALYYEQKAAEYKPYGDSIHRLDRIKAKEIVERVLQQKDSSEGKINSYNLLNIINQKILQFQVEKVNLPNQPFRAFIQYRNFKELHLRLIRADDKLKNELEDRSSDKYWTTILSATPVRSWQQVLPGTPDIQTHAVEIKIDPLQPGDYMLIASTEKNFNSKQALLGARIFFVSNISYINSGNEFFVLHRDNGRPLANANVQFWEQRYDYRTYKYSKEKGKVYKTDANGYFKIERKEDKDNRNARNAFLLDITHNNERFFMDDLIYDHYYERNTITQPVSTSVFLFLDRSLYRPAQTVYFKGIAILRNMNDKSNIVRNDYMTTVILRDANYQDIDSIKVKTNEFGSFTGKFQLPQTGLNGQFSLYTRTDGGTASFRVEEYKRPKFFVDYEPVKGTYKVNDKIKLTSIAKAYAGNNVDGALVRYRVVREPRFIYPWMFWRWWQPPVKAMEIAHGETRTDKDGKFIIEFTAIPDLSIDKKFEPVFDYKVYADVTDINGETRSGEQLVSVSYKSLMLRVILPETLPVDSLKTISIRTENMNGQFEPSTVKVTIRKLKPEQRLIRQRYWERPDQFIMSREEYIRLFPYDEYNNETDSRSWEKGEKVFENSDSSHSNSEFKIQNSKIEPGYYEIEVTTRDKEGQEVKDVKYVELYDEKQKQLSSPRYIWAEGGKPIEPGEKTSVKIGSSADNVFVVQTIEKQMDNGQQATSNVSIINLNNEKRSFDFTATEADRGGYGVSWGFVKHNRFYQYNQVITVPWTNKELKIEYATFRDKTLPGSEERWKLKISGYKNELVAAELLASMYDASLDQFYPHSWSKPSIWPTFYSGRNWQGNINFSAVQSMQKYIEEKPYKHIDKRYDRFFFDHTYRGDFSTMLRRKVSGLEVQEGMPAPTVGNRRMDMEQLGQSDQMKNSNKEQNADGAIDIADQSQKPSHTQPQGPEVQIRKNFNETAFFFPDLRTDSAGTIEFSFTIPEALTRWKFMGLSHTRDAAFGLSTKEIITQKELMVQPNAPRFMREGDKLEFSSKIVNLTDKELTGQAEFQLIDATTNQRIDGWFRNIYPNQFFTVAAGQSEVVKFPIEIPYQFSKALVWRIVARSGAFSDGEENAMPVLTNRMLVTESMPLTVRGTGTKNYTFDKLLKSGSSQTLQHHSLTVEYTSNPAWYAVQALPYLMEYPYDCAEQIWNRYYANSLASFIANSSPRIKQVFDQWKIKDTAALMSNLQKNQELKAVLLEETPWVLQAKTEAEQKKNIALLFDLVRMSRELNNSYEKLKQMQSPNGGFVWFKGGPDDRYMTQYIVTGIGHLKKLKGIAAGQDDKLRAIIASAIPYLDLKIKKDYDDLIRYKANLKNQQISYIQIQYLYMRSFFPEYKIAQASLTAYNYYRGQAQQYWTKQSKYMQGMIALALSRTGDAKTPADILKSLKETSITHEELGMYWLGPSGNNSRWGWFWYEAPIETQALLIEAFQEIGKDVKTVDELKTWLLKNKQTNDWRTTKATAEACYALLIQGTNWLTSEPIVQIKLGGTTVSSTDNKQEAGTGYFKKVFDDKAVKADMGNISITISQPQSQPQPVNTTWGAVYWQYFEDLDKITTAATPLQLVKKLFVEKNTDRGPVLKPVNDGDILKVGDKIKVRIELRVDRDMEYVHMKDMRASALEPTNVLSAYKWQGGLGYYESTRDASTNFFFDYLRKGTYVFEYPLFVTHTGNFSNGITSIQCMYAPEFSSHSEGIRINVE